MRISKYKRTFQKGYEQNYTTEIFEIFEVKNTLPITYEIKDYKNEIIDGILYEPDLVKYNKEDDEFEIEKVIRKKKVNGKYTYLVKWKGYPETMNYWVDDISK